MKYSTLRTMHPAVSFLVVVAFFQAMGGLMGWITSQSVDGWYRTLERSPLNPPDWVFGVAWTALYFLLSVAFWLIARSPDSEKRTKALRFFTLHMVLNWCWTPVFFTAHLLFPAFALIVVLFVTAMALLWLLHPISKPATLILIPYLGWLGFAGHLAHYIWLHNS